MMLSSTSARPPGAHWACTSFLRRSLHPQAPGKRIARTCPIASDMAAGACRRHSGLMLGLLAVCLAVSAGKVCHLVWPMGLASGLTQMAASRSAAGANTMLLAMLAHILGELGSAFPSWKSACTAFLARMRPPARISRCASAARPRLSALTGQRPRRSHLLQF